MKQMFPPDCGMLCSIGGLCMKTIRLLYPDHLGGGLDTYWFGAQVLQYILPANSRQKTVTVDIAPPDGTQKPVQDGIYAKDEVLAGIRDAAAKLDAENPDRVITIGGDCLVSLAPFDWLHAKYPAAGIIWIDAHPDVSRAKDGYPNAHAMVLGALLGSGERTLVQTLRCLPFKPDELLYIGLQSLHPYQKAFLDAAGVNYRVQTYSFVSDAEIAAFAARFDQVLVHTDVDVLDERLFHSTYFANPELKGDGSGGGKMTAAELSHILRIIDAHAEIAGLTIAEYLPFDEERLARAFSGIKLFSE